MRIGNHHSPCLWRDNAKYIMESASRAFFLIYWPTSPLCRVIRFCVFACYEHAHEILFALPIIMPTMPLRSKNARFNCGMWTVMRLQKDDHVILKWSTWQIG